MKKKKKRNAPFFIYYYFLSFIFFLFHFIFYHSMIFSSCYALVIGNQAPRPKPQVRAGDSRRNERDFHQSFATAVQGKYTEFSLYRRKGQ